jgi:hypothetical protein
MSDNNDATGAYVTAEWIRRPLTDLGGLSPIDAAADPEGRKKLDDLLVELAGHHVRLTHLGLPAVSPADVRKALGIEAPSAPSGAARHPSRAHRTGPIKRNALLDELGTALTGGDVDSVAFFNVQSGAVEHFMHNLGDQENARIAQAEGDADLKKIQPVTTDVRYAIMSDFITTVEDIAFAGKLRSAISGKGAFRRFRETVDEDDAMRRRWLAFRTRRHYHIALDWLHKLGLDPAKFALAVADFDWEPVEHHHHAPRQSHAAPAAQIPAPAPAAEPAAAGEEAPAANAAVEIPVVEAQTEQPPAEEPKESETAAT